MSKHACAAINATSLASGCHAHHMRHTYACRMLKAGVSLAAVQQLLGHCTVVMTQRYARLSDEMVRREVERAVSGGEK